MMSLIDLNNYNEGTTIPSLRTETLNRLEFDIPDLEEQRKILSCLNPIDEKIELNNAINNNLLEQVLTLYRNKFVDTANNERAICRADEYFDISIGKTPPRKEPQWFSTNPQDVTWVSILDMGTCGLYISSSSEQLTKQAVERHNVKVVPDNTVLLSFKLSEDITRTNEDPAPHVVKGEEDFLSVAITCSLWIRPFGRVVAQRKAFQSKEKLL